MSSFQELKQKADLAFQQRKYADAAKLYSECIQLEPGNHVLYSNRSACYCNLHQGELALQDAEECIYLNPTFVKGHYRKAMAQIEMIQPSHAFQSIGCCLLLDPGQQDLYRPVIPRILKQAREYSVSVLDPEYYLVPKNDSLASESVTQSMKALLLQESELALSQSTDEEVQSYCRKELLMALFRNPINEAFALQAFEALKAVNFGSLRPQTLKQMDELLTGRGKELQAADFIRENFKIAMTGLLEVMTVAGQKEEVKRRLYHVEVVELILNAMRQKQPCNVEIGKLGMQLISHLIKYEAEAQKKLGAEKSHFSQLFRAILTGGFRVASLAT